MNRKGISPLIAAVLMIAVTMSMAAIITGWAPALAESLTQSTEEQATNVVNCNRANVQIEEASYDSTNSEVKVAVYNPSSTRLNITGTAFDSDGFPISSNDTGVNVTSGSYETLVISGVDNQPGEVTAQSVECSSEAQDTYEW